MDVNNNIIMDSKWQIRKWRTDDDDYSISNWSFFHVSNDNLREILGPGGKEVSLLDEDLNHQNFRGYRNWQQRLIWKLTGDNIVINDGIISYTGLIKNERISGTWLISESNESGEWHGILLEPGDNDVEKIVEIKIFTLWYKKFGDWIKSNWTKVVKYIDNRISDVATTYTNRCWKCHTPIESTQIENKFFAKLHEKWIGNEKCPIPDCNYFLCNKCHKCLCDPKSPYKHMRNKKRVSTKWAEN